MKEMNDMADLKDVTFNVGISISNETVHRCCQLLEIYLLDNPDKTICVEARQLEWSGERVVSVFIGEKETEKKHPRTAEEIASAR